MQFKWGCTSIIMQDKWGICSENCCKELIVLKPDYLVFLIVDTHKQIEIKIELTAVANSARNILKYTLVFSIYASKFFPAANFGMISYFISLRKIWYRGKQEFPFSTIKHPRLSVMKVLCKCNCLVTSSILFWNISELNRDPGVTVVFLLNIKYSFFLNALVIYIAEML